MKEVRKIQSKTLKYKGHNILISFVQYLGFNSSYEVGVFDLDNDFNDLELYSNLTEEDGEFYFNKFVKKYSKKEEEQKIPERYVSFAKDYNYVYHCCEAYFLKNPITNDGSASNFDYVTVYIGKRIKKYYLEEALKPYKLKFILSKGRVFLDIPFNQYQGEGRTIQCKYMFNILKELGYDVDMHYQID